MAKKRVVIIGGGPAAIEAARAAATAGSERVHVTVVTDGPLGGRAGWHSLVPSKVWLAAADTYGLVSEAQKMGIRSEAMPVADEEAVLSRIREVSAAWNAQQQEGLQSLGVEFISATGSLAGAQQVLVKDANGKTETLPAQAIILASGSVPRFPAEMKPDGVRILAPRFASHLKKLPASIVVVGAGATSSEFVYLFNRLGVQVTWVVDEYGVLPAFDPEGGQYLLEVMKQRGVEIVRGEMALRIENEGDGVAVTTTDGGRYRAAAAFIGIGRTPDLNRLNLEAVGLQAGLNGGLAIDDFCRTAVPGIYAAGDLTGGPMLANKAIVQARIAGRHAAGALTQPFQPQSVVHAIYSEPQVAQVGQLRDDEGLMKRVKLPYANALKAHLLPEGTGFIKLAFNPLNRQIKGALAVGFHAADLLAPIALAIQLKASLEDLTAVGAAHPTISELAFLAAEGAATI
jgi:pyruvate/2-oxoglutarate dehydrogenase complex dihydrolipoamide dehydrogenase (E3) component